MFTQDYIKLKIGQMTAEGVSKTITAFVQLHFDSGCRISDLLRIQPEHITNSNSVLIQQSKGSKPLIVNLSSDLEFWQDYKKGLHTKINLYSRGFFNRLYIRFGLVYFNGAGKNNSVTHSARKQRAQEVFTAVGEIDYVASALGHRSVKSSTYYLTDEQKKSALNFGILKAPNGLINNIMVRKSGKGAIIYLKK
jgi:integrase